MLPDELLVGQQPPSTVRAQWVEDGARFINYFKDDEGVWQATAVAHHQLLQHLHGANERDQYAQQPVAQSAASSGSIENNPTIAAGYDEPNGVPPDDGLQHDHYGERPRYRRQQISTQEGLVGFGAVLDEELPPRHCHALDIETPYEASLANLQTLLIASRIARIMTAFAEDAAVDDEVMEDEATEVGSIGDDTTAVGSIEDDSTEVYAIEDDVTEVDAMEDDLLHLFNDQPVAFTVLAHDELSESNGLIRLNRERGAIHAGFLNVTQGLHEDTATHACEICQIPASPYH